MPENPTPFGPFARRAAVEALRTPTTPKATSARPGKKAKQGPEPAPLENPPRTPSDETAGTDQVEDLEDPK